MRGPPERPPGTLLRVQLALVTTLALLMLGWQSWHAYADYHWARQQLPIVDRMLAARAIIIDMDDDMTMAARMAAASGNPQWEARYRTSEPKLDRAIKEALQLDAGAFHGVGAAKTNAANIASALFEHRAFDLVRQGRKAEAQALLSSNEYQDQEKIYSDGVAEFSKHLSKTDDAVDAELLSDLRWSAIATTSSAILLMLGSWFVFRATRGWKAAIVQSNRKLNEKSAELEEFNNQLDRKVIERTRELSDSALASLNMMEDAIRQQENTQQAHAKLDYLAYYDPLTGLANRSLFLERVAQHMRGAASGAHRLALFLIDLERFKNINDSLGQPAGDELLKQVAKWLERNIGDVSLLARVGADHFAVVLPEVTAKDNVTMLLDETMATLQEQPFRLNDAVFRIAAKGGIALFPDDGDSADTLYKHAEAALKQAKTRGDRYLFYTQTMTDTMAGKPNLESQLRQALDNEEFVLHYQPKVNLDSGMLTGAEALIRWNDPRTGLVPPYQFIPILEETGLIREVGRWAMRKAIEDYLRWRNAGLPVVRIAVNVSPVQLRNRGFIAEIEQALGIDAHAADGLELEITESMVMEDFKQSVASLQSIRAMGVSIAIDDFGTGFSSLGYLSKLPIDTLKIDRSFVVDMTTGPQGLSLVSTIISLAHSLKLKVVAEGVETEEQSSLLRLLRCDEMQGYLFSKPVPGDIFEERFLCPAMSEA